MRESWVKTAPEGQNVCKNVGILTHSAPAGRNVRQVSQIANLHYAPLGLGFEGGCGFLQTFCPSGAVLTHDSHSKSLSEKSVQPPRQGVFTRRISRWMCAVKTPRTAGGFFG